MLYSTRQSGKIICGNVYSVSRDKYKGFALLYITKGKLKLSFNGKTYVAEKGDLLFFNQYVQHTLNKIDDFETEAYFMYIFGVDTEKFWNAFYSEYECILKNFKDGEFFVNLVEQITESQLNKSENEYKTSSLIYGLLTTLLSYTKNPFSLDKEVAVAVKIIKENYNNYNVMQLVLSNTYYSKFYFSRLFHSEIGYSIKEYIDRVRFEKAKQLLQNTNLSMEKISEQIGITTPMLNRLFKNYLDYSPSTYRKLKATE